MWISPCWKYWFNDSCCNTHNSISWTITALWTAVDIADATYRVKIPAVIEIASIRSLMENREAVELIAQIKP